MSHISVWSRDDRPVSIRRASVGWMSSAASMVGLPIRISRLSSNACASAAWGWFRNMKGSPKYSPGPKNSITLLCPWAPGSTSLIVPTATT